MWYVLFTVAALYAFGAITGSPDLVRHLEAKQVGSASSEADYARYRGTGESAEDLQPLTREELQREYRVEECDGLLWVYDRQTGELVFLFEKGAVPGQVKVRRRRKLGEGPAHESHARAKSAAARNADGSGAGEPAEGARREKWVGAPAGPSTGPGLYLLS